MASLVEPTAPIGRRAWPVLLAAILSGCSTLIYELGWMRVLTLSVGATYPAITVVLAGMMLGLGLGSILGGRLADRSLRPLRTYAAVEIGVLAAAGCFPGVNALVAVAPLGAIGVIEGRALLAGLLMLPGTVLMGATFPLLSAALHRNDREAAHVPALYGANTLGATLGALLGGLVLPFAIGVPATLMTAGACNALAAGVAWTAGRRPLPRLPVPGSGGTGPTGFEDRHGLLLLLALGSGALVMLAEILWTRGLAQLPDAAFRGMVVESADMMALVMVLVLLGNGLGGLVASRFTHAAPGRIVRALSWTWLTGGLVSLLALEWFGVRLTNPGFRQPWTWVHLALRLVPVAVPSVLLGLSFPLLARLYSGALAGHGKRMGRVWLVNTLGSVGASVLGGWVLMPALGAGRGLVLTSVLACTLGWVALRLSSRPGGRFPFALGAAGLAVVVGFVPLGPGQTLCAARNGTVVDSWEGWEATTVVIRQENGPDLIASNARWIAAASYYVRGWRGTVALIGNVTGRPIEEVMLVGFGTGLFAQGMLEDERLKSLTIVEIDGAQFRAAAHFRTEDTLRDPRVTVEVDDALHYLATTDRTFDAILVDAWGPEASPAIYSLDFHRRALARLRPGGVVWAKLGGQGGGKLVPESEKLVYDAARCAYEGVAVASEVEGEPFAILGFETRPAHVTRLRMLEPCDESSDPLRILHPRRLRLEFTGPTPPPTESPAVGPARLPEDSRPKRSRFLPPEAPEAPRTP